MSPRIIGNKAGELGGGFYYAGITHPIKFNSVSFLNNSAQHGGAIGFDNSKQPIINYNYDLTNPLLRSDNDLSNAADKLIESGLGSYIDT